MSNKIVEKSMEFLKNHPEEIKKQKINISGGEPLLHFNLIKKITELRNKLFEKKPLIFINSNGTLIDKEKLEFIKKNKIGLRVSIDGQGEYNSCRTLKNNTNSFEILKEKLPLLAEYKEYILIRLTISPKYANKAYENVQYFFNHGFKHIEVRPEQGCYWSEEHIKEFVNNSKKIIEFSNKNKIFTGKYKARRLYLLSRYGCMNPEKKAIIDPLGDIYPCSFFLVFDSKEIKKYSAGNVLVDKNVKFNENIKKMNHFLICDFTCKRCKPCRKTTTCAKFCMSYNMKEKKQDKKVAESHFKLLRELDKQIAKII